MENTIKQYKERIKATVMEYMNGSINERSVTMINLLLESLKAVNKFEKMQKNECKLSNMDIEKWNKGMANDTGTTGGYWDVNQTNSVAESIGLQFEHITPEEWNVTMNMMYSDYRGVADKYGLNVPNFYADLSKAFLFDKDGGKPEYKLASYYYAIVKPNEE